MPPRCCPWLFPWTRLRTSSVRAVRSFRTSALPAIARSMWKRTATSLFPPSMQRMQTVQSTPSRQSWRTPRWVPSIRVV
ncbi:hypothetical protein EVA_15083 [gut metagenome]|uniref:Uncharacterized protein n=1 Tax=gut metagenome TaxID=749906 RepID=J9GBL5_9ZZZZ